MRLTVTVVSAATGRQADVAIDADPGSTLAQVAAELDRLMHGVSVAVPMTGPGPWVPALFVGGHRLPGDMRLAGSPLLDGCVVSLGDPSGCPRPEPAGVAELRVAVIGPRPALYTEAHSALNRALLARYLLAPAAAETACLIAGVAFGQPWFFVIMGAP